MSATDELRRLLDERGVEYEDSELIEHCDGTTTYYTEWGGNDDGDGANVYVEYMDGTVLRMFDATPEQAIAATLGNTECESLYAGVKAERDEWQRVAEDYRAHIVDMQHVRHGWQEKAMKLEAERDEWKAKAEQAIAATLGDEWDGKPFVEYAEHVAKEIHSEAFALLEGCDEPDFSAIDAICAACEDVVRIADRWKRGESQDEFMALGSATLGDKKAGKTSPPEGGPGPCGQPSDVIIHETATLGEPKPPCGGGYCPLCSATLGRGEGEWTWFELSCGHVFKLYGLGAPVACPVCGKAVKR